MTNLTIMMFCTYLCLFPILYICVEYDGMSRSTSQVVGVSAAIMGLLSTGLSILPNTLTGFVKWRRNVKNEKSTEMNVEAQPTRSNMKKQKQQQQSKQKEKVPVVINVDSPKSSMAVEKQVMSTESCNSESGLAVSPVTSTATSPTSTEIVSTSKKLKKKNNRNKKSKMKTVAIIEEAEPLPLNSQSNVDNTGVDVSPTKPSTVSSVGDSSSASMGVGDNDKNNGSNRIHRSRSSPVDKILVDSKTSDFNLPQRAQTEISLVVKQPQPSRRASVDTVPSGADSKNMKNKTYYKVISSAPSLVYSSGSSSNKTSNSNNLSGVVDKRNTNLRVKQEKRETTPTVRMNVTDNTVNSQANQEKSIELSVERLLNGRTNRLSSATDPAWRSRSISPGSQGKDKGRSVDRTEYSNNDYTNSSIPGKYLTTRTVPSSPSKSSSAVCNGEGISLDVSASYNDVNTAGPSSLFSNSSHPLLPISTPMADAVGQQMLHSKLYERVPHSQSTVSEMKEIPPITLSSMSESRLTWNAKARQGNGIWGGKSQGRGGVYNQASGNAVPRYYSYFGGSSDSVPVFRPRARSDVVNVGR